MTHTHTHAFSPLPLTSSSYLGGPWNQGGRVHSSRFPPVQAFLGWLLSRTGFNTPIRPSVKLVIFDTKCTPGTWYTCMQHPWMYPWIHMHAHGGSMDAYISMDAYHPCIHPFCATTIYTYRTQDCTSAAIRDANLQARRHFPEGLGDVEADVGHGIRRHLEHQREHLLPWTTKKHGQQ